MHYLFNPFRRTFDFRGRATRRDLWLFALWYVTLFVVIFVGSAVLGAILTRGVPAESDPIYRAAMTTIGIWSLAVILPMLALQVRRLHDISLSGAFVLLHLLPGIGSLALTVMTLLPGTPGPNAHGDDPRARGPDLAGVFT